MTSGSQDFDLHRFYGGLLERFQNQHGVLEDIIARSESMIAPKASPDASLNSQVASVQRKDGEGTFQQAVAVAKELKLELESLKAQTQQAKASTASTSPASAAAVEHLDTIREAVAAAKNLKAELDVLKDETKKASASVVTMPRSAPGSGNLGFNGLSSGLGASSINVFLSSVQLNETFPSVQAISELLYGDPKNTAKGADIIVLFCSELVLQPENVTSMKKLLRRCVMGAKDYIFSEDMPGLAIEGIPCQLAKTATEGEVHDYIYMGVAVKKTLAHDENHDGTLSSLDVFPMPAYLSCGAVSEGAKADEYRHSKSIMLQHIQVRSVFSQFPDKMVHLLICGVNLDNEYGPQKRQLEALERQLNLLMIKGYPFTALLVGDINHHIPLGEEFKDDVIIKKPDGKKKKIDSGQGLQGVLKDSAVEKICRKLMDPKSRRKLFFQDTLHFTGQGCFGKSYEQAPPCAVHLSKLFDMYGDLFQDQEKEVPLPTYKATSTSAHWSQMLGFAVELPQLVTEEMIVKGVQALEVPQRSVKDVIDLYLPKTQPEDKAHARVLKPKLGDPLYIQGGWLDGIGVYKKGTCPAQLTCWKSHDDIYSFDHVPVTGSVDLLPTKEMKVRVWCGSIKLDNRFPSTEALKQLLYKTEGNSARDADVIALFATDLQVTKPLVKKLQNLLYNALDESERDKYIFNENEAGLVLKAIPAQLMKMVKGKPRYIALYICLKKGLAFDPDVDGIDIEDVFPQPPELICRSDMKNESAPSFKGHMAQTVVIKQSAHECFRLVLVGLNFDTADDARVRQCERLEHYMKTLHAKGTGKGSFAVVIFGDFNNRLVCPDWLANHVSWQGEGPVKGPVLTKEGAWELCARLADPGERLKIMKSLDSWVFEGKDATGKEVCPPAACKKLRDLFTLHFDICTEAPLPTYKRTPLSELLGEMTGFPLELGDLVTRDQLIKGFSELRLRRTKGTPGTEAAAREMFFGTASKSQWVVEVPQEPVKPTSDRHRLLKLQQLQTLEFDTDSEDEEPSEYITYPPRIELGWPDRVGVLRRGNMIQAQLLSWTTCDNLRGGLEHTPIRGSVRIFADP